MTSIGPGEPEAERSCNARLRICSCSCLSAGGGKCHAHRATCQNLPLTPNGCSRGRRFKRPSRRKVGGAVCIMSKATRITPTANKAAGCCGYSATVLTEPAEQARRGRCSAISRHASMAARPRSMCSSRSDAKGGKVLGHLGSRAPAGRRD